MSEAGKRKAEVVGGVREYTRKRLQLDSHYHGPHFYKTEGERKANKSKPQQSLPSSSFGE